MNPILFPVHLGQGDFTEETTTIKYVYRKDNRTGDRLHRQPRPMASICMAGRVGYKHGRTSKHVSRGTGGSRAAVLLHSKGRRYCFELGITGAVRKIKENAALARRKYDSQVIHAGGVPHYEGSGKRRSSTFGQI